ncbi:IS66 family insertion sequence element accessory protein TnpB, partial [Escherichia coli]|uniref:IS66 family insertion sequence element accessory protein TnpB n=1 Tax=Escherichia coli TaxID=562 RepID=UPI003C6C131A
MIDSNAKLRSIQMPFCSFNGLASKVQNVLKDDPFSGHLFIFRGRRGDQIKVLWADSDGL